ncbi:hypothetical protein [Microbacterium sp. H1-D42]|uniref:hypothetical protein n=1 Tax=Microbacterium sp. H1-D42 TaxID=2925844 RepID=UPI001F5348BA|nr:hypothetical protein [Microbacterium sp. H1-D42]UNK72645.1 hypothetical protein MNR00_10955 [Microbacterium sp. H1-D42]
MSGQTWTPAPKKSAIPLHPMTFGMILGRAFAALRHNPKVLFGFAVAVQFGITLIAVVVMLLVSGFTAARIASVPPGSPDLGPIVAGSVALAVVVGIVIALASVAFTAIVQGLVAADVSFAALGRKAPLRQLWHRMRPAFWRLFAYSLLQGAAVLVWLLVVGGVVIGVMAASGFEAGGVGLGAILGVFLVLGSIPLLVWLSTKLLVVPAVLVLEHATIGAALVRSWRLIRGRFWPALGVMFLIGAIMGLAAQVVSIPGSIISAVLGGVLAPTGSEDASAVVAVMAATILPQILVLAVQAITLVVQGTGATLIYLDSRMRYEGLDQTLIRHVERAALGTPDDQLGDPYALDPARAVGKTPPPAQTPPAPGYTTYPGAHPTPSGYPAPGYPAQPSYAAQPGQYPAQPGHPAQPSYPAQPGTYQVQPGYPTSAPQEHSFPPPPPPAAQASSAQGPPPPASDSPATGPDAAAPNTWTAPGGSA